MKNKEELRSQVIQLLKAMAQGQNILQCIKEALILHQQFSPISLFQAISKDKQKITKSDLINFLEDHQVAFKDQEIKEFFQINRFGKQITFNQFLDSVLPFNADALRTYKEHYLSKLNIRELDDQVEFIYRELLENGFKFIRVLDKIKTQIIVNSKANIETVTRLIKNDLIEKSKVRQGRKFQEKFQENAKQISFIDLRRFLELWVPTHEVMLLNLMRFLRSQHPLKPINLNLHHTLIRNKSAKSLSTKKINNQEEDLNLLSRSRKKPQVQKIDKYEKYKRQVEKQYLHNKSGLNTQEKQKERKVVEENELIRRSRWQREKKGIQGEVLKKIFRVIITKEERLQKLRKKLAKSKDFNLINLFKLIDRKNTGILNSQDIEDYMNRVYGHQTEMFNLVILRFGKQKGILRFHEFCEIFRPLSKQLNQNLNSRPQNQIPNPFKIQTNRLISEILRTTLDLDIELHSLRQTINDAGYDSKDQYRFLDLEQKGYVVAEDIKQALQEEQFCCDLKDMKLIMKHFKKRIEQKINFTEFKRFLEL